MTTFTFEEIAAACKNIGYDLACGACAELFFTGVCLSPHDTPCETPKRAGGTVIVSYPYRKPEDP